MRTDNKLCPYCKKRPLSNRKDAVTCGKPECRRDHEKHLKHKKKGLVIRKCKYCKKTCPKAGAVICRDKECKRLFQRDRHKKKQAEKDKLKGNCEYCGDKIKRKCRKTCGAEECKRKHRAAWHKKHRENKSKKRKAIERERNIIRGLKKRKLERESRPKTNCKYCGRLFIPRLPKTQYACHRKACKAALKKESGNRYYNESLYPKAAEKAKRKFAALKPKKCIVCGKTIKPPKYKRSQSIGGLFLVFKRQKACSKACRREASYQNKRDFHTNKLLDAIKNKTIITECVVCNKDLIPLLKTSSMKNCRLVCEKKECKNLLQNFRRLCNRGIIPPEMYSATGIERLKFRKKGSGICERCGKVYQGGFTKYCSEYCSLKTEKEKQTERAFVYRMGGLDFCKKCGKMTLSEKRKKKRKEICFYCDPYPNHRLYPVSFYLKNFKLIYIKKPCFFTGKAKTIGRVIRKGRRKPLLVNKYVAANAGYPMIRVSERHKVNEYTVAFILKNGRFPAQNKVINHIDHIKENSDPANLQEVTHSENMKAAARFYSKLH